MSHFLVDSYNWEVWKMHEQYRRSGYAVCQFCHMWHDARRYCPLLIRNNEREQNEPTSNQETETP